MSQRPSLVVEPIDREHLDAVVECITTVWTTDNVIARALGVTADEYRPMARRICEQSLADDLAVMLRDPATDRIMGFYTATDLVDELELERDKVAGDDPKMARWGALLSRGLRWYLDEHLEGRPVVRGQVLYLNIGGTRREIQGQGWINRMGTATMRWIARDGYQDLLGLATHPHSVNMMRSLPVPSTFHEIPFADLDDPDLSRITEPPELLVGVIHMRPGDGDGDEG